MELIHVSDSPHMCAVHVLYMYQHDMFMKDTPSH